MRRDLEDYLMSVQKQYNQMLGVIDEANQLAQEGKITEEKLNEIQTNINLLNANYQRVLYCRYLVSLPPKWIQKLQQKKLEKQMKKFMAEQADKESIEKENQEYLDQMEDCIKNDD